MPLHVIAALFVALVAAKAAAGVTIAAQLRAPLPSVPAQGMLLIASADMGDPRFAHAVILLTAHGERGASGVILNRPTVVPVVEAIPAFVGLIADRRKVMFYGGPVEAGVASVLVRSAKPVTGAVRVLDDVYAVSRLSLLSALAAEDGFEERARFYGGYSGWGPGQLEAELARGDWSLVRATADHVFRNDVGGLWNELSHEASGLWVHAGPGGVAGALAARERCIPAGEPGARRLYWKAPGGAGCVKIVTNLAAAPSGATGRPYNFR